MIDIHIGLDLSFESTGITFYNEIYNEENNELLESNIEFHRLVRDKEVTTIMLNLNQHIYYSKLFSVDLDLKHKKNDDYSNAISYSSDQIDLTEKYYIIVNNIMKIIINYVKTIKTKNNIKNDKINIYVNFEGSILSGYNFNTQIGVNMLQGYLRAELLKFQLANNFNLYKFRMIPPTNLKLFFANDGNADKKLMIESFINNYDGQKLLPQIDTSNKKVSIFNDVIDSFALVAFNVYDMKIIDKFLFKISKPKNLTKIKKRKRKVSEVKNINDLIDTKVLKEFENNNISSNILKQNNIL